MHRVLLVPLFALLAAGAASAATIEGRVADEKGRPVNRVRIQLRSLAPAGSARFVAATQTDKEGKFRFDRVKPGWYEFVAEKRGWTTGEQSVILDHDDQHAQVEIPIGLTVASLVAGAVQMGGLLYVFAFGLLTFYFNFTFLPQPSKTVTGLGWTVLAATVVIALIKLDVLLAAAFALCGTSGAAVLSSWGNRRAAARRAVAQIEEREQQQLQRERDVSLQGLLGQRGVAHSNLNPYGDAHFDGRSVEVKSSNGFIARATPVVVQRIEGRTVIVEPAH
jgi:membrane protein implicated in regulation of membrane protease activity